jgi:NAD(P)H-dependent FMN reductase
MKPKILVMLATAREGRQSEKVAKFVMSELNKAGEDATLFDAKGNVPSSTTPIWQKGHDPSTWAVAVRESDAIVVVCPEYNHSYPGEFKMIFDSGGDDEYDGKPIAFVTVSSGVFAGVRLYDKLVSLAFVVGLSPIYASIRVGSVEESFSESGVPVDPKMHERFSSLLTELKKNIKK